MNKKSQTREGDFIIHLIADILVRIAFFVGTAVAASYMLVAELYRFGTIELIVVLVLATLAAILGPYCYQKGIMRGRGSLRDIRDKSRDDR